LREPRYPAARSVAPRLLAHFAQGQAPAGMPLPDEGAIEALVDAAFWASLQREEGYVPEISLAFLPPESAVRPLRLSPSLPLAPRTLSQLSPAVERPGIHLGVHRSGGELRVWGTTRTVPPYCFVLEVIAPGLLVVKHRVRDDSAKFRNLAVFQGDEVKLLGQGEGAPREHPALLLPLLAPESAEGAADVLLRLAVSMRGHRRGGTLLVVPAGSQAWRESIVQPIGYAVEPAFTELGELARELGESADPDYAALGRAVDAVAGLTAVDGATLITDRFELLAFGVKIARPHGQLRVERVCATEPVEGSRPEVLAPLQLGGTRHISAAQFAQDQKDAFALVASQDGRFTVFAWCEREGMVHAHRVEALLL
jgi:Probable sensor domain DACNV